MSFFKDLKAASDVQKVEDRVGGAGFAKIDATGLYKFTIVKAYAGKSLGGAYNVTIHFKEDNGAKFSIVEYITSGTEKGSKEYYLDKDGNKQPLPGYNKIKNLDNLLGYDREFPETRLGQVMLWDYDSKAEVPVEKDIVTEWIGKKVSALIIKKLEDKYNNTTQTDIKFEVEHFLDYKTNQTRNEKFNNLSGFKDKWLEVHTADFVVDKRVGSKDSVMGTPLHNVTVESDDFPFDF
jgi:hypothetical protein